MTAASPAMVVATLNVRNTADLWRDRAPLLVEQLAALDPHLVALQEVRRVPDQARRIAPDGWNVRRAFKTGPGRAWRC
jgi:endonuclease/exonuclease/phosphatase family metal-dependent hydrolase